MEGSVVIVYTEDTMNSSRKQAWKTHWVCLFAGS